MKRAKTPFGKSFRKLIRKGCDPGELAKRVMVARLVRIIPLAYGFLMDIRFDDAQSREILADPDKFYETLQLLERDCLSGQPTSKVGRLLRGMSAA